MTIEPASARDIARELARKYNTLDRNELNMLESILEPKKYFKGEMILREGEICDCIYYIDFGLIRQFYFKKGRELTEHLGEDRSIFMCIESLFCHKPTKLQVEALEPTHLFTLPKKKLEKIGQRNVNIQILYRKILEESLIISQIHADLVRFETAYERYRRMLMLFQHIIARTPLVHIASYLQMTPETLSRIRKAMLSD